MVTWRDGRVATSDSVEVSTLPAGADLRDRFWEALRELTLGLVRRRGQAVAIGPLELLRFGNPEVAAHSVEWPIHGGLLARDAGGRWRIAAESGKVSASLVGYRPSLLRPLYALSQLQVHKLFTRLFLLRLRGRSLPPEMTQATVQDRRKAALVDIGFCLIIARNTPARRPAMLLGLLVGYHIVCWSTSGRTLGGLVVGQRVSAVDGRTPTPAQALVRMLALPVAWVLRRPVHDEFAGTEVIAEKSG